MATILVIDDDAGIRRLAALTLSRAGHAVIEAGDGLAGLRLLREKRPDVVLVDIFMPEMDGIEFIREMAERPDRPGIIAMSGGSSFAGLEFLDYARRLGADAALPKPLEKSRLLGVVEEACRAAGNGDT